MKENIALDKKTGKLVITKQEHIEMKDVTDMDGVKLKLKQELAGIVQQVKGLKTRAEEIKAILDKIGV